MDWFDFLALWIGRTILVLGGCFAASMLAGLLLSETFRAAGRMTPVFVRRKRKSGSELGMERRLDLMGNLDRCWVCGEGPHDNELCPRHKLTAKK